MEGFEVRRIAQNVMEDFLIIKECPFCKFWQPMVKISRLVGKDEEELMRCLGCLHIFQEKLVAEEVIEGGN